MLHAPDTVSPSLRIFGTADRASRDDAGMTGPPPYALLDAGDDRRLESFGGVVVDRPAPTALEPARDPEAWASASARFDDSGLSAPSGWVTTPPPPDPWLVGVDGLTLELRATDNGQVGLFPEHGRLWPWLLDRIADRPRCAVLHLFAYTGATTLALARAGASVAHVDASRSAVAWARANADRSALADLPIRWLVDDAAAFVAREARRGRRYDGIVLDPPSYGHGPRGQGWRLGDDLGHLLDGCAAIAGPGAFVLLTTHTQGEDADRLADRLAAAFPEHRRSTDAGPLDLVAQSGATLHLGSYAAMMGG